MLYASAGLEKFNEGDMDIADSTRLSELSDLSSSLVT